MQNHYRYTAKASLFCSEYKQELIITLALVKASKNHFRGTKELTFGLYSNEATARAKQISISIQIISIIYNDGKFGVVVVEHDPHHKH